MPRSGVPVSLHELGRHLGRPGAGGEEQHQQMIEEIRGFLDQGVAVAAGGLEAGDDRLDGFFADLLSDPRQAGRQEPRGVAGLGIRFPPPLEHLPQPAELEERGVGLEAAAGAAVAGRARRPHPQEQRVAVAVGEDLRHLEDVPRGRPLAP